MVPAGARAQASFRFKQEGVICGLPVIEAVWRIVDPTLRVELRAPEGSAVQRGTVVAVVEGSARSLLMGERVALNFLQRLSAVASLTRRFVETIAHTKAQLLDTRKTTPGLRALEKYAVRVGGGRNHRFNLADAIMIKDNHIAMAGSISEAVRLAREGAPATTTVEVEVETLAMVREALEAGADIIMLDNMSCEHMREAVSVVGGRARLEASGGIDLQTIRVVAETGVDFISVGALTHSAGSVDISLDISPSV